ncbi:MAG: BTAD domain-containing putative transcriptional regulator [Phycisphaerales bacterium]
MQHFRPARRFVLAMTCVTLGVPVACESNEATRAAMDGPRDSTTEFAVDRGRDERPTADDPVARLFALAAAERSRREAINLAPPEGLDPVAVTPVDDTAAEARLTLDEALARFDAIEPLDPPAVEPVNEDDRAVAVLLYLEARDAFLDADYFEAVPKLEQARQLDASSPAILRLLARTHVAMAGESRALGYYDELLRLEPGDSEALLRLGMSSADRGDWTDAATRLAGAAHVTRKNDAEEIEFESMTPDEQASRFVALHELGLALRALGYDRAAIDAWMSALDLPARPPATTLWRRELQSLYRERGDTWLSLGDSLMRLDEIAEAILAYRQAQQAPLLDPGSVTPRLVYALRRQGRPYSAAAEFVRSLESLSDHRVTRLVEYLEDSPAQSELAAALAEMARANPDNPTIAKAAASILPVDEGIALLLQFLQARPSDDDAVRDIVRWAAERERWSFALQALLARPESIEAAPEETVGELVALTRDLDALTRSWERLPRSTRESSTGQMLSAMIDRETGHPDRERERLIAIERAFPDYTPATLALADWRIRHGLSTEARSDLLTLVDKDGAMSVGERLTLASRLSSADELDRALTVLDAVDRDLVTSSDSLEQRRAARRARVEALLRHGRVQDATEILEATLLSDPKDDLPYLALMRIYGPDGPLTDVEAFREVARALARELPESRAFRLIRAEQDARYGRASAAIPALQGLLTEDPTDDAAITALVEAYRRADQPGAGVNYVRERLDERPNDRAWRQALVELLLADDRGDEAVDLLTSELEARPRDWRTSRRLEETLYRTNRAEEARRYASARLAAWPESPARELALARLAIEGGATDEALRYLESARVMAAEDLDRHLEGLLSVASQLADATEGPAPLEFAVQTVRDARAAGVAISPAVAAAEIAALIDLERSVEEVADAISRASADDSSFAAPLVNQARAAYEQRDATETAADLVDAWMSRDEALEGAELDLVFWRLLTAAQQGEAKRAVEIVSDLEDGELSELFRALQRDRAADATLDAGGMPARALRAELLYAVSVQFYLAGDDEGSERLLVATLEANPDHSMANNNLAYALLDRNERLGDAERMLLIALEQEPDSHNVLDSLGWLRYKQGRFEDTGNRPEDLGAVSLLEAAAAHPDGRISLVILDHLGDAYWRAGREDDAQAQWRQVVRIFTDTLRQLRQNSPDFVDDYLDEYQPVLEHTQAKLDAAENSEAPSVAYSPAVDDTEAPHGTAGIDGQ